MSLYDTSVTFLYNLGFKYLQLVNKSVSQIQKEHYIIRHIASVKNSFSFYFLFPERATVSAVVFSFSAGFKFLFTAVADVVNESH